MSQGGLLQRIHCHEVLEFRLGQMTSCCFGIDLEAESALCCHTGDWNYKRHFSQRERKLSRADVEMSSAQYWKKKEKLLEAAKDLRLWQKFVFLQVTDHKHAAAGTIEWFESKDTHVPEWPSQSPDPQESVAWQTLSYFALEINFTFVKSKFSVTSQKINIYTEFHPLDLLFFCHQRWHIIQRHRSSFCVIFSHLHTKQCTFSKSQHTWHDRKHQPTQAESKATTLAKSFLFSQLCCCQNWWCHYKKTKKTSCDAKS